MQKQVSMAVILQLQLPAPDAQQAGYPSQSLPAGLPSETPPPFHPEEEYVSFIPQEGKEGQEFYKYERLILKMVVLYGERVMCNAHPMKRGRKPLSL